VRKKINIATENHRVSANPHFKYRKNKLRIR